jgi:hypothetical protein
MNSIKYILNAVGYVVFLSTLVVSLSSCTKDNHQSANKEHGSQAPFSKSNGLVARSHNSDFEKGGTSWVSTSVASNGKIYYTISTSDVDQGARIFSYDPKTEETKFLADLTEICGEKNIKAIPQGKSHSNFYEKTVFYTHQPMLGFMVRFKKVN